ncbi:MAG: hypothetical protein WBF09_16575 [Candidatus Acidiferrum sp.]
MTPLLVFGVALFLCALIFCLVIVTSFLAVLFFRFAPTFEGGILSRTPSDFVHMLRQMPVYPTWWHHGGVTRPKQNFVVIVINPVRKAEYLWRFDPLHRPIFTANRNEGMQFDFEDLLALKTVCAKLEEECVYPFVAPADLSMFRASGRRLKRWRRLLWLNDPPFEIRNTEPRLPRTEHIAAYLYRTRRIP